MACMPPAFGTANAAATSSTQAHRITMSISASAAAMSLSGPSSHDSTEISSSGSISTRPSSATRTTRRHGREPRLRSRAFQTRSRDEWCAELEGTDVCFAPVLSFDEAPRHPHFIGRESFIEVDGVVQPAPAPRFSRTPSVTPTGPQGLAPQRLITPWPAGSKPRQYARGNDEASLARKQCKPRPCAREVSTAQAGLKPGTRSRYVPPPFQSSARSLHLKASGGPGTALGSGPPSTRARNIRLCWHAIRWFAA
jgi:hypothetical protein